MILEADMYPGEYQAILKERGLHFKAEQHIKEEQTCPKLRDLLNLTMLKSNIDRMEGLDTVDELVKQISFRKYTKDAIRAAAKPPKKLTKQRGAGDFGAAEK